MTMLALTLGNGLPAYLQSLGILFLLTVACLVFGLACVTRRRHRKFGNRLLRWAVPVAFVEFAAILAVLIFL